MVRRALLEREKELTRLSDELAEQRQTLPRVRIDEPYTFATDRDEDAGRTVHGPNTPAGCSGCTFAADSFDGSVAHLNAHDVTFVMASRSPPETLSAYQRRMGWSMPWVSSGGTDINRDFTAWTEEDRRDGTGWDFGSTGGALPPRAAPAPACALQPSGGSAQSAFCDAPLMRVQAPAAAVGQT